MFRDNGADIRSDLLSWVLRRLERYAQTQASDDSWLPRAIAEWHAECDFMPTGLRLLKLDPWLTSKERCAELLAAIAWTRAEMLKALETGELHSPGFPLERYLDLIEQLIASKQSAPD